MKIYISVDVEGLNGVTYEHQIYSQNEAFKGTKKQLNFELNTLIEALFANKVDEIIVNDAHELMDNVSLTDLPPNVSLITGKPKAVSMMYALDKTFDGAILLGYHAKVNSKGVLAHTFSMDFEDVKVNGQTISEGWLNSYYSSIVGVPVLMASGDDVFCDEIKDEVKGISTVCTKTAIAYTGAICKANELLAQDYRRAVKEALNSETKPILETSLKEFKIEITFKNRAKAANFKYLALPLEVSNGTVAYKAKDFCEMYKFLQFCSCV